MKLDIKTTTKSFIEEQKNDLDRIELLAEQIGDFNTKEIRSSENISLDEFKLKNVLYYFELDTEESLTPIEICNTIEAEKSKPDNVKLPLVNKANCNDSTKVLYVGKSGGYFSNRLKQHLGYGHKSTYALHLKQWETFFGREVKLKLYYISIDRLLSDSDSHLLELIETAMHRKLQPILGRTGS